METIAVSQLYLLLAALGVGLTLIALVGRGLYVWGRMSRQVDDLGDRIDRLETKVDGLIVEVQQLNRTWWQPWPTIATISTATWYSTCRQTDHRRGLCIDL